MYYNYNSFSSQTALRDTAIIIPIWKMRKLKEVFDWVEVRSYTETEDRGEMRIASSSSPNDFKLKKKIWQGQWALFETY